MLVFFIFFSFFISPLSVSFNDEDVASMLIHNAVNLSALPKRLRALQTLQDHFLSERKKQLAFLCAFDSQKVLPKYCNKFTSSFLISALNGSFWQLSEFVLANEYLSKDHRDDIFFLFGPVFLLQNIERGHLPRRVLLSLLNADKIVKLSWQLDDVARKRALIADAINYRRGNEKDNELLVEELSKYNEE